MKKRLQIIGLILTLAGLITTQVDILPYLEGLAADGEITGGSKDMISVLPVSLALCGLLAFLFSQFMHMKNFIKCPNIITGQRGLILIITFGVLLRIIWLFAFDNQPFSDAHWFNQAAIELSQTGTYSFEGEITAYRPVGYPTVIAAIYYIAGYNLLYMKLFNLFLYIALSILMIALYNRPDDVGSLHIGLLLYAILPSSIAFTGLSLSEPLFTFLMFLSIYLFRKRWSVPAGICIGIMTLVRPVLLPFFIFYPILRGRLRQALLIAAISTLVILPWSVRNYNLFNAFVLVSTNGGVNLYIGNNENANGAYMEPPEIDSANEAEASKKYSQMAIEYIYRNPFSFLGLLPRKLFYFFFKDNVAIDWTFTTLDQDINTGILHLFSFAVYFLVLFFGILGLWKERWQMEHWLFLYFILFYLVFFGADRFHFPLMPILCIYAGRFIHHYISERQL